MGKTILTPNQIKFLELAQSDNEINRWFYLTGGTALSEFYLHHRLSEDIDLFSYSQVNNIKIENFIKKIKNDLKIKTYSKNHIMGLYTYKLYFQNNESLKIDFNEYPFTQVEINTLNFGKLKIDSFYDIAVNKANSVTGRFQIRDFIDLYFILKKREFDLDQLISRVEDKFGSKIDEFYLSSQFLRITDLPRNYPKMLVPFDFDEMVEFFKKEAKRLGNKSFKK